MARQTQVQHSLSALKGMSIQFEGPPSGSVVSACHETAIRTKSTTTTPRTMGDSLAVFSILLLSKTRFTSPPSSLGLVCGGDSPASDILCTGRLESVDGEVL